MGDKVKLGIPKQKKDQVKTYKQTVVNAVILVVVLFLFLYVAIQLSRNFSAQVSTQRTQKVTDVSYTYFEGCIFKDSAALSADGDIIHYLVSDGEKVGVGQAYAEIYSGTSIAESERQKTEQRLNELSERIDMLEAGLEGGKTVSDLGGISDDISDSYCSYIDSVLGGDLSAADKSGDKLLSALVDYSAITLSESAKNILSQLKEERSELISSIGGVKKTLVSQRSFTFTKSSDGYEDLLNSSLVSTLTPGALDSLMSEDRAEIPNSIGSTTFSAKWYIALPCDEAGFEMFKGKTGNTYEVGFLSTDGLSVNMLLEAAVADEENSDKTYLLFSSFDLAKASGLDRHQSVRITLSSRTGYRIPSDAVHTVGEDLGVYVLIGNVIEFRRITLIGEGDGYYIVNTYEDDLAEDTPAEIPYLNINDLIVTSGRDLYDGKLLD